MKPNKIIVHHSLTKDGWTVSWQAIRKFHTGIIPGCSFKFHDIGYHFGIEQINDRYEILQGLMIGETGAHCRGQNKNSIGVCLIGNFDETVPDDLQIRSAVRLISSLCDVLVIPHSEVYGHRHFAPYKTCPGANFSMTALRNELI